MLPKKCTIYLDKNVCVDFEGISMRVTRLSKIYDDNEWEIDAHAHSNYEFHYIYEGKGIIHLGNNEFVISERQFYACPPFIEHSQQAYGKNPMKEFCIECQLDFDNSAGTEYESSFFSQFTNKLLYCKYDDQDECIMSNFHLIDEFLDGKNSILQNGEMTVVKATLINIILTMLIYAKNNSDMNGGASSWSDINHQRAISIRNYIEANYKGNITITDCAKIFYMSERQIDRILTLIFQETFHGYLNRIRVNVASNLICETDYSMEMVASEAGFSSYRQMLRNFKKYNMETPSLIRKKKRLNAKEENKRHK